VPGESGCAGTPGPFGRRRTVRGSPVTQVAGGRPIDERRLARALRAFRRDRDERSFRELYREATPYLWAFACRLAAGREPEAEELTQETWVRAVERLDAFRGESAFTSWLGGVLLNVWRESRRELRWWSEGEPPERGASAGDDGAAGLDLERALAELPDGARAVVLMHDLEGLTHEEIGARLGIPAGTSKRRLFEARRRLRGRLRPESGGDR
jgi:RNA polymerase sigma-70 factor (ECF subfamily)